MSPRLQACFFQDTGHYRVIIYIVIKHKLVNTTHTIDDLENMVLQISLNIRYATYIRGQRGEIITGTSYQFFVFDV